ncbi:MAG: hypothetical protein KFB97_02770 [Cyanobium sp. M30B3]|nr:MAG: hypothetical protein KFB97_02770 [Cyanobium sp. M30B3]
MLPLRSRRAALLIACSLGLVGVVATASAQTGERAAPRLAQARAALTGSSARQQALANHLKARGAIFFGAWWCPACTQQKALFGKQAGAQLPYVECTDAKGSARCSAAGIRAFPTWDMPGKERLVGVQSVEELARWSGFRP